MDTATFGRSSGTQLYTILIVLVVRQVKSTTFYVVQAKEMEEHKYRLVEFQGRMEGSIKGGPVGVVYLFRIFSLPTILALEF
jgi:predicted transposase YdaD